MAKARHSVSSRLRAPRRLLPYRRMRFGRLGAVFALVVFTMAISASPTAASYQQCQITTKKPDLRSVIFSLVPFPPSGQSSQQSYQSLQEAQDAATAGATLWVQGTCTGSTVINKNLTIIGVPRFGPSSSVLFGRQFGETSNDGAATLDAQHLGRVLLIRHGVSVTVENLAITGGQSSNGGGVINRGNLTLVDANVRENSASNEGGGIYNDGRLILDGHSSISGNSSNQGGGIYNRNRRTVTLNGGSSISGNSSHQGGGIYDESLSTVTLNDYSGIFHNKVDGAGGGIFSKEHNQSQVTLNSYSRISGNSAANIGGGVRTGGRLILNDNSAISGNHADKGAGIFTVPGSRINLAGDSTVSWNVATTKGGGIFMNGGTVNLHDNSVIARNLVTSGTGGGIYRHSGTLNGAVTGPGGNVYFNRPDNIAP